VSEYSDNLTKMLREVGARDGGRTDKLLADICMILIPIGEDLHEIVQMLGSKDSLHSDLEQSLNVTESVTERDWRKVE
jgi:hypothetical protein